MSLLKEGIIRKEKIDKKLLELNFDISNTLKYKVELIRNIAVYASKT